jgi:AP-3 complex subunit mu
VLNLFLKKINKRLGNYVTEEVNGEIKMNCKVSGMPEFNVYLQQPHPFNDFSVHECLYETIDSFDKEKILNFIPPTGQSSLLFYKYGKINIFFYL